MNLFEKIKSLLLSGKSEDEVLADVVDDGTVEEIAENLEKAKKAIAVKNVIVEKVKKAESEAKFSKAIKEAVETELKTIKVANFEDGTKSATAKVVNSGNEWHKSLVDLFTAIGNKSEKSVDEASAKIRENNERDGKAFESGTGSGGGYFLPHQFDSEIDKLMYTQSELLNEVPVIQGTYHTMINGIGTVDMAFRANQNAAYATVTPTFTQVEIDYQEAGGMAYIPNNMLKDSAYNIVNELTQAFADAKIRLLEPLICTGRVTTSLDAFNGIWFSGISGTDQNAVNKDSGTASLKNVITSEDLMACMGKISPITRNKAVFVLTMKEFLVLVNEQTTTGANKDRVFMDSGKYYHRPTGKRIIVVDTNVETLTASAKTGGLYRFAGLFDLSRLRVYSDGGLKIATDSSFAFDKDLFSIRFTMRYKQGIPANSLTSFVRLVGVGNAS